MVVGLAADLFIFTKVQKIKSIQMKLLLLLSLLTSKHVRKQIGGKFEPMTFG
jgi:hypothetical protein